MMADGFPFADDQYYTNYEQQLIINLLNEYLYTALIVNNPFYYYDDYDDYDLGDNCDLLNCRRRQACCVDDIGPWCCNLAETGVGLL